MTMVAQGHVHISSQRQTVDPTYGAEKSTYLRMG